jgi:hypothetical protein
MVVTIYCNSDMCTLYNGDSKFRGFPLSKFHDYRYYLHGTQQTLNPSGILYAGLGLRGRPLCNPIYTGLALADQFGRVESGSSSVGNEVI